MASTLCPRSSDLPDVGFAYPVSCSLNAVDAAEITAPRGRGVDGGGDARDFGSVGRER